jgi:hypothetical protein
MTPHLEAAPPAYVPRDPSQTVLYRVVADHLETFLASLDADPDAKGLPAYVEREFYDYLQCGILAHGFLRLGCETCQHEMLLAFSCKAAGVLSVVCGAAHGPDRRSPRRAGHALGPHAPMGRVGACPRALLDSLFAGPHREGPYDYPHRHRVVLCAQSRRTRLCASQYPTRVRGCTPLRVCHPGPGHPAPSSPTASSALWQPAGSAGEPTPTGAKGLLNFLSTST